MLLSDKFTSISFLYTSAATIEGRVCCVTIPFRWKQWMMLLLTKGHTKKKDRSHFFFLFRFICRIKYIDVWSWWYGTINFDWQQKNFYFGNGVIAFTHTTPEKTPKETKNIFNFVFFLAAQIKTIFFPLSFWLYFSNGIGI